MIRDELQQDKRLSEIENLETQYGTCRFCGQLVTIHPLFPWAHDKLDECACEICGCTKSTIYAGRKERKERAAELIELKFGVSSQEDDYFIENCETVCALLNSIASAVIDEIIGKTSVRITDTIKCDISLNSDGSKIKVCRTITHKDTEET